MGQVGILFLSDSLEGAASEVAKFLAAAQAKAQAAEGTIHLQNDNHTADDALTAAPTPPPVVGIKPLEELNRQALLGEDAPSTPTKRQRRGSNFRRQGVAPTPEEVPPAPAMPASVPDLETVREKAKAFGATYGGHELRAILQHFGVLRVAALAPASYSFFCDRLAERAEQLQKEQALVEQPEPAA